MDHENGAEHRERYSKIEERLETLETFSTLIPIKGRVLEDQMRELITRNKMICDCILELTAALESIMEAQTAQGTLSDGLEKSIEMILKRANL